MSTLLWGDIDGVPADQAKVRATTAPVEIDAPPAEMDGAPEFNEVQTDPNPNLGGLAKRNVASDWHESEQYAPWWADNATREHNAVIDRQVATSGTAAAKELTGAQGHGSMPYAVGIEPVLRDGGAMGNDYFAADKRDIQDLTDQSRGVAPAQGLDRDTIAGVAAYGKDASHDANNNMSELYARIVGG